MLISVVIPVYKDFERLKKCIQSIDEQGLDKRSFEVVIVNNDSEEDLPALPENELSLKVVDCMKEGSYAARNKGVKSASGDYIAFTDSDCIADDEWLENLVKIVKERPEVDLVAGNVVLFPEQHAQPNPFEAYDMMLGIDQNTYAKKKKSVTANLVVKRKSFIALQGFDESNFSGGDHEFCDRANKARFKFQYVPGLIVYHPARNCMAQIVNKAERRVGGRLGTTSLKKIKTAIITLMPPFVRFFKVIKSKNISWKKKIDVIKIVLLVKKHQIVELYKVVFLDKSGVR